MRTRGAVELRAGFVLVWGGYWGDDGRTTTNAADDVIEWLWKHDLLHGRQVIYEDTEGRWDELAHSGGLLMGFLPVGAKSPEQAIRLVRQRDRSW